MHEFGMCEAIVEAVERRAQGRRVTGVKLRVGTLHRVVEPAMDQAFAAAAVGTVAENATVELVVLPVQVTCRECGAQSASDDHLAVCATCGSADVALNGGDELMLESIKVAD